MNTDNSSGGITAHGGDPTAYANLNDGGAVSSTQDRGGAARRRRRVTQQPTFDYCRSCRERKLKCDGERPSCRRCRSAGRVCGGYTIWQVHFNHSNEPSLPQSLHPGKAYQAQLLGVFTSQHYPDTTLAAPTNPHSSRSFLHSLVGTHQPSPILERALETLCLAQLAADNREPLRVSVPLQASYIRVLSSLRTAMGTTARAQQPQHHRDIVATIATLSLLPTANNTASPLIDADPSFHLLGAAAYLLEHGPEILRMEDPFDMSLLKHTHVHSAYIAFARRKRTRWNQGKWKDVQQITVNPPPEFPAAARYVPGHEAEAGFLVFAFTSRNAMTDFVHPLPELLERADLFVQSDVVEGQQALVEYEELTAALNQLQSRNRIVSRLDMDDIFSTPAMIQRDDDAALNMGIEEHVFMFNNPTFHEQYGFASTEQGFNTAFFHQLYLIADCALLQVMSSAFDKGIAPNTSVTDMKSVEQRAYWHASELVRCTYFYSQRSLTAAKFLHSLLCCARNFFESYGAVQEMEWCQGCSLATNMRMNRLRPTSRPTICRLGDIADDLSLGCRYGGQWRGVIEQRVSVAHQHG